MSTFCLLVALRCELPVEGGRVAALLPRPANPSALAFSGVTVVVDSTQPLHALYSLIERAYDAVVLQAEAAAQPVRVVRLLKAGGSELSPRVGIQHLLCDGARIKAIVRVHARAATLPSLPPASASLLLHSNVSASPLGRHAPPSQSAMPSPASSSPLGLLSSRRAPLGNAEERSSPGQQPSGKRKREEREPPRQPLRNGAKGARTSEEEKRGAHRGRTTERVVHSSPRPPQGLEPPDAEDGRWERGRRREGRRGRRRAKVGHSPLAERFPLSGEAAGSDASHGPDVLCRLHRGGAPSVCSRGGRRGRRGRGAAAEAAAETRSARRDTATTHSSDAADEWEGTRTETRKPHHRQRSTSPRVALPAQLPHCGLSPAWPPTAIERRSTASTDRLRRTPRGAAASAPPPPPPPSTCAPPPLCPFCSSARRPAPPSPPPARRCAPPPRRPTPAAL